MSSLISVSMRTSNAHGLDWTEPEYKDGITNNVQGLSKEGDFQRRHHVHGPAQYTCIA